MRRVLCVLFLSALSGCNILFMAPFDSVEYDYVVQIRTLAQQRDCSDNAITELRMTMQRLTNFSQYIPDNEPQMHLNKDLSTVIDELYKAKSRSPTYCEFKLAHIEKMAERLQSVMGNKPR